MARPRLELAQEYQPQEHLELQLQLEEEPLP
jgi:hypothetical protein